MLLEPEIPTRLRIPRRHNIPRRPAPAQMVQAREPPRNMVRRVVRRAGCGCEPDLFGDRGERGEQGEGLERCYCVAALEGFEGHVEYGEVVGHEESVEFGGFQSLGEGGEVFEVEVCVGVGARVAPGSCVEGDGAHECCEVELAFGLRVCHVGDGWFGAVGCCLGDFRDGFPDESPDGCLDSFPDSFRPVLYNPLLTSSRLLDL